MRCLFYTKYSKMGMYVYALHTDRVSFRFICIHLWYTYLKNFQLKCFKVYLNISGIRCHCVAKTDRVYTVLFLHKPRFLNLKEKYQFYKITKNIPLPKQVSITLNILVSYSKYIFFGHVLIFFTSYSGIKYRLYLNRS